jgi:hypothetical protein
MSTKTQKNIQWVVASATALVIIGVGLNIVVTQMLESFSPASVILALYVGFWAFVLGNIALILSSIWLFIMSRKLIVPEPTSGKPRADDYEPEGLQALGQRSRMYDERRDRMSAKRVA